MIKDLNGKEWKVTIVTPAGRQRHLEILRRYIERDMKKGFVDSWQLWQNTGNQSDIDYMKSICEDNPKIELKTLFEGTYDAFKIFQFFQFANDPDTVYIRMDDDICYVHEYAILELFRTRTKNPDPFVICANIVDNTVISYIHQKLGILGTEKGKCNYSRLDNVAWADNDFVENVHRNFMKIHKENSYDILPAYSFKPWIFTDYEPFSISCFAFFAKDLDGIDDPDEEMYISSRQPERLGRPNIVDGAALVVHYGYHTQRPYLDTVTDIYEFYNTLSLNPNA